MVVVIGDVDVEEDGDGDEGLAGRGMGRLT